MSVYFDGEQFWLTPLPAAGLCPKNPTVEPVADWARRHLNFDADPVQTEVINTTTPRLAVCTCRHWGKSTVAAVKALHFAWTRPAVQVLFVGRNLEQSAALLRRFRRLAVRLTGEQCHAPSGRIPAILLPNGSRISALPQAPESVRTLPDPDLIVIDDAAFVPEAMHRALSTLLGVATQLWLFSSPNGVSGEFHKVWHATDREWRRFSVTAGECPRLHRSFLDRERRANSASVFGREYMCQFVDGSRAGINPAAIADAFRGPYPAVSLLPAEKQ